MRRLAALVLVLVPLVVACGGDEGAKVEVVGGSDPVTHEYVIPFGTYKRLQGGERVELVPQTLRVKVGDSIRIRNDDSYGSQVGIFHVGAGETVTMRFKTPGVLEGECDVHPSGKFIIDVREA